MALIVCPECKTRVSDAATTCPNCGYPVGKAVTAGVAVPPPPRLEAPAGPPMPLEEKVLWEGHPSLLLLTLTFLRAIGIGVAMVAAIAYRHRLADAIGGGASFAHAIALGAWVVLGVTALHAAWRVLVVKNTRFSLTTQRVRIERGVVARAVDEIDLRVIDDTSFRQGVLQRVFGIGDIEIESHDPEDPDFVMRGVRDPRKVRELIRAEAYSVSQRSLFTRQA